MVSSRHEPSGKFVFLLVYMTELFSEVKISTVLSYTQNRVCKISGRLENVLRPGDDILSKKTKCYIIVLVDRILRYCYETMAAIMNKPNVEAVKLEVTVTNYTRT